MHNSPLVGSLILWPADTPPVDGYLPANGALVDRLLYADLFSVIGITYGAGDGFNTFALPDVRGLFPRFTDAGAGLDPNSGSRVAPFVGGSQSTGSKQSYAMASHVHNLVLNVYDYQFSFFGANGFGASAAAAGSDGFTTATGGSETRPRNVTIMGLIKV